jgi:hypothetical protein
MPGRAAPSPQSEVALYHAASIGRATEPKGAGLVPCEGDESPH